MNSHATIGLGVSYVRCRRIAVFCLMVWLGLTDPTHTVFAQRNLKDIPNPDPEVERLSFQVAPGFEVNLFAADPLLAKPIQMNFDDQGRLWVASSEVYPQIAPGQEATDKILILTDRDGNGTADSTDVFVSGLLIPTGVLPGDGGAYVANSTELVHFRDTNNDNVADEKKIMLSGFGTEDTHHILHTLRWGNDGKMYFNQSIYIHSHIETPFGPRRLGGGGIWQYEPSSDKLEVFVKGWANPWGHWMDRWGQSFATDGAGYEGIHHAVPGFTFRHFPVAERFIGGLNPGSPKHCGLTIVSGRHLPDDWQGNLLTNDFRANRVCRFVLSDNGSGYSAREMTELIKTSHSAFRPIDTLIGPDGAIYIADWYNPIIQHGEVDFRDPRRDHTRGRIWRVTAKGRPTTPRPNIRNADVPALLEALKAPEDWTRAMARQRLKELGAAAVLPKLDAWVAGLNPSDPDKSHQKLEALWVGQALRNVKISLLDELLKDTDGRIRAAAVRVAAETGHLDLPPIAGAPADPFPRVRLEVTRALGRVPTASAATQALRVLDSQMDEWLDFALWLTLRELKNAWLPAVQSGELDFGGNSRKLVFALQAAGSPEVVPALRKQLDTLITQNPPNSERLNALIRLIGSLGGPEDLGALVQRLDAKSLPPDLPGEILANVANAARTRNIQPKPADVLNRLLEFANAAEPKLRSAAVEALGSLSVQGDRDLLQKIVRNEAEPIPLRVTALESLVRRGAGEARLTLDLLAQPTQPEPLQRTAIIALAGLAPNDAAPRAAAYLASLPEHADPVPLLQGLLTRPEALKAVTKALVDRRLAPDVAKVALRTVESSGRPQPDLLAAIRKAGKLDAATPAPTGEARTKFLNEVLNQGDPKRGEAIFRRSDLNCMNCHAIASAGGQVGPSLESIGAAAPVDYLTDSLWEPNKAIKENFGTRIVVTHDGKVMSGIPVRRSNSELSIRDAEDIERVIPIKDIAEEQQGGSLMPEGLLQGLTRTEQRDLIRYLSELGKPGPYAVGNTIVARRWRVLVPNANAYARLNRASLGGIATSTVTGSAETDLAWTPAYTTVSGHLPINEFPKLTIQGRPWVVVRTELEVTRPGTLRLAGSPLPPDARIWLQDQEIVPQSVLTFAAAKNGVETLTIAVPVGDKPMALRWNLVDEPNSGTTPTGAARFVVGK